VDYTLQTGKKIEVPFEQLIVFSTNLEEKDLVDEAFLRRMGYRAKVEPPSSHAYVQIFRREAAKRSIEVDDNCLDYLLEKYAKEGRQMKGCEPRDLLDRITDICLFEDNLPRLDNSLLDVAWQNYFGASHKFSN
jgi:Mg-chelatase subunit ChlI